MGIARKASEISFKLREGRGWLKFGFAELQQGVSCKLKFGNDLVASEDLSFEGLCTSNTSLFCEAFEAIKNNNPHVLVELLR